MGAIVDLLGGAFGGGIIGLLGGFVQRFLDFKLKRLEIDAAREKHQHEVAMREADARIMAQEWAARTEVARVEAGGREAEADARAFAASFNEPQRYSEGAALTPAQNWLMVSLDFIRGLVRPGLTLYLCGVTTLVYVESRALVGRGLAPEQALDLVTRIVDTVLYLTIACVLWWFGARVKNGPPAAPAAVQNRPTVLGVDPSGGVGGS